MEEYYSGMFRYLTLPVYEYAYLHEHTHFLANVAIQHTYRRYISGEQKQYDCSICSSPNPNKKVLCHTRAYVGRSTNTSTSTNPEASRQIGVTSLAPSTLQSIFNQHWSFQPTQHLRNVLVMLYHSHNKRHVWNEHSIPMWNIHIYIYIYNIGIPKHEKRVTTSKFRYETFYYLWDKGFGIKKRDAQSFYDDFFICPPPISRVARSAQIRLA